MNITSWLQYDFMRNALIAVLIITPLFGIMGTMIVNKKMAYFSDALGHSALTGIAVGVVCGMADTSLAMVIFAIVFALLLNEIKGRRFKKVVQTIVYLPYFMSWVILGGIFRDMLSPGEGIINQIITAFGGKSIFFLGDNRYFRGTMIVTDIWKNFGYGAIVYLAAILGIDTQLYEAAQIDGANRWQQTWHVTLPGMKMIIVLMMVLSLGNVLNAGFDQIFNMYSTSVYQTGDIIDTFVYRLGLLDAQYGPATAVGLFKSVISTLFISISYFLAYKLADYRIF